MPMHGGKRGRGRATKEERRKALELYSQGRTIPQIASQLGFREARVANWVQNNGAAPAAPASPSGAGLQAEEPHKAGDPAKAFAALGGPTPPAGASADATRSAGSPLPPPPTPEELIALTRAVDGMTMKAIVGVKFSGFPAMEVAALCEMPEQDAQALLGLAPYAARRMDLVLRYVEPALAWVFVGVWSFSIATRYKAIQDVHRERFPEKYAKKKGGKSDANPTSN